MERKNITEKASKIFHLQSLLGDDKRGLERKIRYKKQEIEYHQNHINHLEMEINEIQKKLDLI